MSWLRLIQYMRPFCLCDEDVPGGHISAPRLLAVAAAEHALGQKMCGEQTP